MNDNVAYFFPTLQDIAARFYGTMIPIAALLVLAGLIVAISRAGTDLAAYIRAVLATGMVGLAISYYPDWSNQLQSMAYDLIEELDAEPSKVHTQFARLVAGTSEEGKKDAGLWDVVFSKNGGLGHAILYAWLLFLAKVSSAVMWLFAILQQVLIQFQVGLAPVFLAMFTIPSLRNLAVQFQMHFVAVLLWPVGWGIAAVMTNALLKLAATNEFYKKTPDGIEGGIQTDFLILTLSIWILFSTIAAPLLIRKLLTTGTNAGAVLLSNVAMAVSQGLLYGVSAGASVAMAGGSSAASSGAAAIGGAGGAVSGSLGSTGVAIPSAIGIGAALSVSNASQGGPSNHNEQAAATANQLRS